MANFLHKLLMLLVVLPSAGFAADDNATAATLSLAGQQLREQLTIFAYHDVREDIKREYAADQYAMSAENLAMHFAWLRDNDYNVVSLDQVLAAEAGQRPLPPKAVLLTFDDGLASVYTTAYPLLKLFNYPALVSVVTAWIETEVEVAYENHLLSSRDFLTWEQMREMQDSGLIDIASHTHNMHRGGIGNPQGNEQPLAVTRLYQDGYEAPIAYLERIEADIATSASLIKRHTGKAPRAIVWPYGQYNTDLKNLAAIHGMDISFSLDSGNDMHGFATLGRELMVANPGIPRFIKLLTEPTPPNVLRAAQVDLDYVYDPDPVVQEENLGVLLDRIKGLGISHVFLQAFADPDGDGAADALYFPNRHMPMRADLFNRVAWQLRTRCEVKVFAWMPLLAYTGSAVNPEWQLLQVAENGEVLADPDGEPRLSVFEPRARQFIKDIYSDLAIYTHIEGIHFHDDGRMNELEDANPAASLVYREVFGPDFSIDIAQEDPVLLWQWSEFKAAALIDFSLELQAAAEKFRPMLRTSRNLFASSLLDERGTVYLAQNFDEFLSSYDYVTVMAMPMLEGAPSAGVFYKELIAAVNERPDAFKRTVFQLQTVDWRDGHEPVSSAELSAQMRRLQSQGVRNIAYYPDDFLKNHPSSDELMQGMSLSDHPVVP
jgi:biofilm PGA synthesis lipoprotein PgaB